MVAILCSNSSDQVTHAVCTHLLRCEAHNEGNGIHDIGLAGSIWAYNARKRLKWTNDMLSKV
jgi:hypothetical protein